MHPLSNWMDGGHDATNSLDKNDDVRRSVEVRFESLGQDDATLVNFADMCAYIRKEFQRDGVLHDLNGEYRKMRQRLDQPIREYMTLRKEKQTVLQNLGIEIDPWVEKTSWLDSINDHLRKTIKKESGY
eukprot:SAG11_NODE_838_length_6918_cov_3.566945_7_plen_129_part_00